jgi:hypothetical protein
MSKSTLTAPSYLRLHKELTLREEVHKIWYVVGNYNILLYLLQSVLSPFL